jgi:glutamyl-tRNA reductase
LRTLFDLDPETVARVSRADGADRPPAGAVGALSGAGITGTAAEGTRSGTSTMNNTENAKNRGRA